MRKKALLAGLLILVLGLGWCFHRRLFQNDEKAIRAVIEQMRTAAEAKNTAELMKHFSPNYKDRDGNNKFIIDQIVRRSLVRVDELRITIKSVDVLVMGDTARVSVTVTGEAVKNGKVTYFFGSEDEPETPHLTFQKTSTGDWLIIKVENVRGGDF
jgi:hypothetical protein